MLFLNIFHLRHNVLVFRKRLDLVMVSSTGGEKIIKYSTPKLKELIIILSDYKKEDLALVFVERRTTAKVLYYIFQVINYI